MYKNIHTISTKCQYIIEDSKPKWWVWVKWYNKPLHNPNNKKIEPIITWNPWKPVPKKKQDPKIPSDIVNALAKYSTACKTVKNIASTTVKSKPFK